MKRHHRISKPSAPKPDAPTSVEEILAFGQFIGGVHQEAWQRELHSDQPDWTLLLGLHLRLAELEHMESAAEELL
jgi:hypothetical protein